MEAHAVAAWPAAVTERIDGGWVLRASPGLNRGRSNHALTPCRELSVSEIPGAIDRVEAFARGHGVNVGIQVSHLQVEERNVPAVALYQRLGFREAYRYCHRIAPAG